MAAEEITRFLAALDRDSSLQDKTHKAVSGAPDNVAAMAAVARAAGFDFTDDELRAAVERLSRELSEKELGQVAGGFSAATSGLPHRLDLAPISPPNLLTHLTDKL